MPKAKSTVSKTEPIMPLPSAELKGDGLRKFLLQSEKFIELVAKAMGGYEYLPPDLRFAHEQMVLKREKK